MNSHQRVLADTNRARWSPLLAALLGGCTLLSAPEVEQCDVDADCAALGVDFAGSVCKQHVCVAQENGCTSMSDCGDGNTPYACIESTCVQLTSEDCPEVVPAKAISDDTVYVGWMGPLKDKEYSGLGIPIKQGAELALEEIEDRAKGIPIGAGGARKKLALIACHDLDDVDRVAEHLIEKVRVPAIVGPTFSGITLDVATRFAIPQKTLLLSPSATSPAITGLMDDGLVWRTVPSDALQAFPLGTLLTREETRIRADLGLAESDPIRVVVAAKGEAYGQGLFDSLTPRLRFNGKSATENGSNFLPVQYGDPSAGEVDYSSYVSTIVDFAPHIVVLLGTTEVVSGLLVPLEQAWPTREGAPPPPSYLLPDGGRDVMLLSAVDSDNDLRLRIHGTVPGRKGANYDSFALRFKARFANKAPGTYAENAYDAGYLLAYAMLAAGQGEVTGPRIAQGLAKMSGGTRIIAQPQDINSAITALTAGSGIDFEGASGSLDFDTKTGEAPADVEIWCVVLDQGKARFESSGEYYDAKGRTIAGENTACAF